MTIRTDTMSETTETESRREPNPTAQEESSGESVSDVSPCSTEEIQAWAGDVAKCLTLLAIGGVSHSMDDVESKACLISKGQIDPNHAWRQHPQIQPFVRHHRGNQRTLESIGDSVSSNQHNHDLGS